MPCLTGSMKGITVDLLLSNHFTCRTIKIRSNCVNLPWRPTISATCSELATWTHSVMFILLRFVIPAAEEGPWWGMITDGPQRPSTGDEPAPIGPNACCFPCDEYSETLAFVVDRAKLASCWWTADGGGAISTGPIPAEVRLHVASGVGRSISTLAGIGTKVCHYFVSKPICFGGTLSSL